MSSTERMKKLIHRAWNTFSQKQKVQFLKETDLENVVDKTKLWFELEEAQQKAIVKWFLTKLGLTDE